MSDETETEAKTEGPGDEPEDDDAPLTRDEFMELLRGDVNDFEVALKEYEGEVDEEGNKFPEKLHADQWFTHFMDFLTAASDEDEE